MGRRDLPLLINGLRGIQFLAAVFVIGLFAPLELARAQNARTIDVNCPQANIERDEPLRPIYYPHRASASNVAHSVEQTPESLLTKFMHLHTASRYQEALIVADELVAMVPEHPLPHYNRACALARLQRTHDALDALERAIDHGWRDLTHLKLDPDLQSIRWHDRYESLVASLDEARGDLTVRFVSAAYKHDRGKRCFETLGTLIPHWLDEYHVPGASIAFVQGGAITWSSSFGVRDRSTGDVVQADDPFALPLPDVLGRSFQHHSRSSNPASPVTGHTWMGTPICNESSCAAKQQVVLATAEQFGRAFAVHFRDHHDSEQPPTPMASNEAETPNRIILRPISLERWIDDEPVQQLTSSFNGIGWHVSWDREHNRGVIVLYNAERGEALAQRIAKYAMPHLHGE